METSDSDYFESADEDFHCCDESDKKKTKIKSETRDKLHTLHLQENEQSITPINKKRTQEESLTRLIKGNFKNEAENNVVSESSVIENTKINLKSDVTLNAEYKEKTLNNKNEFLIGSKNDENEIPERDNYLNKRVLYKEAESNETTESNNDLDNMWNEEDWIVDYEKSKENNLDDVCKISTELKDNAQNTMDAVEENMWENDEWEPINKEESSFDKSTSSTVKDNVDPHIWGSWGNWGVSSVLSSASQSVSTLTTSVSHGISTVLESSIGVPDPEELAKLMHSVESQKSYQNKSNLDEEYQNKHLLRFGFSNIGSLVSGVSKLVESTSTKVISGGLDTLETIGKKTMEVLQEGDPGLKKKRAFLKLNVEKPVLSQVLREAKEKVEQQNETLEKPIVKKMNYETLFDDHQGLVHLEALEMLSKQCEIKLQTLIDSWSGESLSEIQETISQVKELCELPDEDEHEQMSSEEIKDRVKCVVDEIGIHISYDRLLSIWEYTELWLNNVEPSICDEMELHQRAIDTLARLTAVVVEQFHKTGELLFIKDHHNTADEADGLVQLTTILTSVISIVAGKFSEKLNAKASRSVNEEEINSLITNVFFEAANSSSYIQDAFQLLVPVLQIGSVKV